jgi:hypothetical protein
MGQLVNLWAWLTFAIKQSLSILNNIDSSLLANHSARQTAPDNATTLSHGNTSFVKMEVKILATLAMLGHALVSDPKWPEVTISNIESGRL